MDDAVVKTAGKMRGTQRRVGLSISRALAPCFPPQTALGHCTTWFTYVSVLFFLYLPCLPSGSHSASRGVWAC